VRLPGCRSAAENLPAQARRKAAYALFEAFAGTVGDPISVIAHRIPSAFRRRDVPGTPLVGRGYADMIQRFPEDRLKWLTLVANALLPRDPNNYNGDDDDEEGEDQKDEDHEPAVIREPDPSPILPRGCWQIGALVELIPSPRALFYASRLVIATNAPPMHSNSMVTEAIQTGSVAAKKVIGVPSQTLK
jgi:hypothetical protein